MSKKIRFKNIREVIEFVGHSAKCEGDVTIDAGNNIIVNGKSLMSIFALNLKRDLEILYDEELDKEFDGYINKIAK